MNMYNNNFHSGGAEREQLLEMLLAEIDCMVHCCRNDEHRAMECVSRGCLPSRDSRACSTDSSWT